MIKIEDNKFDLALYVINLKIADTIKNNKEKEYNKFKTELTKLIDEKRRIYKNDKEIINKILNVYLEEIRGDKIGE